MIFLYVNELIDLDILKVSKAFYFEFRNVFLKNIIPENAYFRYLYSFCFHLDMFFSSNLFFIHKFVWIILTQ